APEGVERAVHQNLPRTKAAAPPGPTAGAISHRALAGVFLDGAVTSTTTPATTAAPPITIPAVEPAASVDAALPSWIAVGLPLVVSPPWQPERAVFHLDFASPPSAPPTTSPARPTAPVTMPAIRCPEPSLPVSGAGAGVGVSVAGVS